MGILKRKDGTPRLLPRIGGKINSAVFPRIGAAIEAVNDALLSPGHYTPQITETKPNGEVVVVQPEIVEKRGWLRDPTVWQTIAALFFALANAEGWNLWFTEAQANSFFTWLTAVFGGGAAATHVRSWMPLKGSAVPTPTRPADEG